MTVIRYERGELRLSFEGHAHSAEPGRDLVCAAASALAFTAIAAVEEHEDQFFPAILMSDGKIMVACRPTKSARGRCRDVLDTVWAGCEMLSNRYPEFVRTEKEN